MCLLKLIIISASHKMFLMKKKVLLRQKLTIFRLLISCTAILCSIRAGFVILLDGRVEHVFFFFFFFFFATELPHCHLGKFHGK